MKHENLLTSIIVLAVLAAGIAGAAAPVMQETNITPTIAYRDTPSLIGYCNATDADLNKTYFYYDWYKNGVLNSSGSTRYCYQDNVLSPGACGATGNYSCTGYFYPGKGCGNIFKAGDIWAETYSPHDGNIYLNYTKPSCAQNTSLWYIEERGGWVGYWLTYKHNYSLHHECFNEKPLQLWIRSVDRGVNKAHLEGYCNNGTGWQLVFQTSNSSTGDRVWDDGIYWDIACEANQEAKINNSVFPYLKNENWTFGCIANDGLTNSTQLNHTLTISNSASSVESLQILPVGAQSDQDLYFSNFTTDLDNDTITDSLIIWYKNEVRQTALDNTSIVLAANTSLGDEWVVNLAVYDGTTWSSIAGSAILTVGDNTSPELSADTLSDTSGVNDQPFTIYVNVSETNSLAWVRVQITDPNGASTNWSMSPGNLSGRQSRAYAPGTDGYYTFTFYAQDGSGNSQRLDSGLIYTETTSVGGSGGGGGTSDIDVEGIVEDRLKGYVTYAFPGDTIKVKWLPVEEDYRKEVIITASGGDVSATIHFSEELAPYFSAQICDLYTLICGETALIAEGEQKYVSITADFTSPGFVQEFEQKGAITGSMHVLSNGETGPYSYNITIDKHLLFDKTLEYRDAVNEALSSSYSHKSIFNLTYAAFGLLALLGAFVVALLTGLI